MTNLIPPEGSHAVVAQIDAKEVQRIRNIVEPIALKYGVERMYLFGSRAIGDGDRNSDFDFSSTPER